MARSLKNKPQVQAPTLSYPFGRIKDDTGLDDGTPVNEDVYGDLHQFFECLLNEATIPANELPENEYNGFQYLSALKSLIRGRDDWHVIPLINSWTSEYGPPSYRRGPSGLVTLKGGITNTNNTPSAGFGAAGSVPAGNGGYISTVPMYSTALGRFVGMAIIAIGIDGSISSTPLAYQAGATGNPMNRADSGTNLSASTGYTTYLDGISYWERGL